MIEQKEGRHVYVGKGYHEDYMERIIYEETLERVKDELSGPESEEIRKERLVKN